MKTLKIYKQIVVVLMLVGVCFGAIKGPNYDGLRSMGMGNTTVAVTTDRTAIFHNPAGLSLLKEKVDVSISPIILGIDGKFFKIANAMLEQGDKLTDIANIDPEFIDMLNELDGEWVGLEWIPEITLATRNLGFGMYTNLPVGVRLESGHLIPKLGFRGERDLVFTWAVGVPLKTKNTHLGISVEYLQRTPLAETITSYSETFIYFDKIGSPGALGIIGDKAEIKHGVSFDVGMMHNLKGFRIAYDIKDLLGVIGGEIVFPPQIDAGCAYYFPQIEKVKYIDNLILACEFSDIFGIEPVTEEYEHPIKKLHLGAELDLHYAAIRLGLNQGYPTAGLGLRLGLFMLDYVFFTEELGYYPGQLPRTKHVLSMGIGFKTARPEKLRRDTESNEYNEGAYEESDKTDPPKQKKEVLKELKDDASAPAIKETPSESAPLESAPSESVPLESAPSESMETTPPPAEQVPDLPQEQEVTPDESAPPSNEGGSETSEEEDIGWQ